MKRLTDAIRKFPWGVALRMISWGLAIVLVILFWVFAFLWFLDRALSWSWGWWAGTGLFFGLIVMVTSSVLIGGFLRRMAQYTDKLVLLTVAVLSAPLIAGLSGAASEDLRRALGDLPDDLGQASAYAAYFGTWLVTLTYMMKVPWDRATEIIRDRNGVVTPPEQSPDALASQSQFARFRGTPSSMTALAFILLASVTGMVAAASLSFRNWLFGPPDNLVTLIGAALVCVGLLFTARQWRADQAIKHEESAMRQVQLYTERLDYFRTPETRAAIMMLLNYERDVRLPGIDKPQRVTWDLSAKALIPGNMRAYLYEELLIAIRDCFNDLLEGMHRLEHMRMNRMLRDEDVDHICKPLIQRIALDPSFNGTALARNLRLYTLWRNASGVLSLFVRYGAPLDKRQLDADRAVLEREIADGIYGPCEPTSWGSFDNYHRAPADERKQQERTPLANPRRRVSLR